MYDLATFREQVKELCRRSYPYDDRRHATQGDLAEAIGLHATELSKRLNGAKDARLSDRDVRAIVLTLAEWGAITTQAEALDLLNLVGTAAFRPAEWQSPPLDELTPNPALTPAATHHSSLLTPHSSTLPQPLTSFIGRTRELEEVSQLLSQTRLLTITGTGGVGKSRLALEIAMRLEGNFPDGTWLVEIAAIADPQLVLPTIAATLGAKEQATQHLRETLVEWLRPRQALLLLDNCEHLVDEVAEVSYQLLARCPGLRVLTTSREALRAEGEVVWRLLPLSLPQAGQAATVRGLAQYEAVRLFIERAKAAATDFAVSQSNAAAIQEVCERLDGLPLAIELAAVMVRVMAVEQIRASLDDRFALLQVGRRTALPRQRTLKALVDWSYTLLDEATQRLFARLAVFAASFSLEAAAAVCASGQQRGGLMQRLGQLVDKSLLVKEGQNGATIYRMLETLREYAAERLAESGETNTFKRRHAEYYVALAELAEGQLHGTEQETGLTQLEQANDNLRGALTWSLQQGESELALRLAAALWRFWYTRGHLSEGRRFIEAALAGKAEVAPEIAVKALNGAGVLAHSQGDYQRATQWHEEALRLAYESGDERGVASSLNNLGLLAWSEADYATAQTLLTDSLTMLRALGDRWMAANSLNNLGLVVYEQGEYGTARELWSESLSIRRELGDKGGISAALDNLCSVAVAQEDYAAALDYAGESLRLSRELGDMRGIALTLDDLGDIAYYRGDYAVAQRYYEESLGHLRKIGYQMGIARSLINLGKVACKQGDLDTAGHLFRESLPLEQRLNYRRGITASLAGLAEVALKRGQAARGACLIAAADHLRETIAAQPHPSDRRDYRHVFANIRQRLSHEDFTAAWDAGKRMSLDEAVAFALRE